VHREYLAAAQPCVVLRLFEQLPVDLASRVQNTGGYRRRLPTLHGTVIHSTPREGMDTNATQRTCEHSTLYWRRYPTVRPTLPQPLRRACFLLQLRHHSPITTAFPPLESIRTHQFRVYRVTPNPHTSPSTWIHSNRSPRVTLMLTPHSR